MFDRHDVTYAYTGKERLEKSLRKAARERVWEQTPEPSWLRQVVAQVGNLLVLIGSRLQTTEQHQPGRFMPKHITGSRGDPV